jgi:hypothetical protein
MFEDKISMTFGVLLYCIQHQYSIGLDPDALAKAYMRLCKDVVRAYAFTHGFTD